MNKKIYLQEKQAKILKVLNIFLASIFSLCGLISIVSFTMYLNTFFKINYLKCLLLIYTLTKIYSSLVNIPLNKIDKKRKDILKETNKLILEQAKKSTLEDRYNNLSKNNQLKLLKYTKEVINDSQTQTKEKESENILHLNPKENTKVLKRERK